MTKYKHIYVIGVFDLFHVGHVEFLRKSKALGEKLVVAINGDDLVANYKRKPFFSESDRLEIVQSCKYVDEAFIIHDYDNRKFIEHFQIDAIVHGNDWDRASYLEQIRMTDDYLNERGTDLVFVPYTKGISTSQLIKLIKEN